jgi:hypothetical protein
MSPDPSRHVPLRQPTAFPGPVRLPPPTQPIGSLVFWPGPPCPLAVAASPASLDYARIAANQRSCQETLKAAHSSSLQLQHVDMQGEKKGRL